jgi:hypothetical protein
MGEFAHARAHGGLRSCKSRQSPPQLPANVGLSRLYAGTAFASGVLIDSDDAQMDQ